MNDDDLTENPDFDDSLTAEERRAAQLERARAARRGPTRRRCAVCPNRVEMQGRGRYCSNTCRDRAYRARKRAASIPATLDALKLAIEARNTKLALREWTRLHTMLGGNNNVG